MTTYLGNSCPFGLPRVPFVNCRQFMYLVISLLVLRAGCGIIAYLFTLFECEVCGNLFSFSDFSENWLGEFQIRNCFLRSGAGV